MFDVIGFDADDTLWHNESIFTMTQEKFREILSSHGPEVVDQTLSSTQINNLEVFGYGIKGFILSMIETSIEITNGKIQGNEISEKISKIMDLSPYGIKEKFSLNRPIYSKTAAYGHFGRKSNSNGEFPWEELDLVKSLKSIFE